MFASIDPVRHPAEQSNTPVRDEHRFVFDIPRLSLSDAQAQEIVQTQAAGQPVALAVAEALRNAPYCMVIDGLASNEDPTLTKSLAWAIACLPSPSGEIVPPPKKLSFTRVFVAADRELRHDKVTRYSRTHLPLGLHTDSSYKAHPHELVAFQMVRTASTGGETLLSTAHDIADALAPDILACLKQPIFPFGKGYLPIFWSQNGQLRMRYYRSQIEVGLQKGAPISNAAMQAIEALEAVLARRDRRVQYPLQAGEILFLNNTQILHGREGFAPDSDRLMYRVRAYAPSLS